MKAFKFTSWLKPNNAKSTEYRVYSDKIEPYNVDESGKKFCKHKQEVADMVQAYRNKYPHANVGFLVGSSLVGNKQGDSARFWELTQECEKLCTKNHAV